MTITKSLSAVFVGTGLLASGLLLGQTWADGGSAPPPAPAPASTDAVQTPVDAIALRAADRAALLQLCIAGRQSAEAAAYYREAAAAHPEHAARIGPDCTIRSPQAYEP